MKIQSNSKSLESLEWLFPKKEEKNSLKKLAGAERINASLSNEVTESVIEEECKYIERCAASNKKYVCNSSWKKEDIETLREYAIVSGLPKDSFVLFNPTALKTEASSESIVRTASSAIGEVSKLESIWKDPFSIEEKIQAREKSPENWQKVSSSKSLGDKPVFSGINAIRGGEDYFKSPSNALPSNQNSISNYDKISKLANSEDLDTGERLRLERKTREEMKIKCKKDLWDSLSKEASEATADFNNAHVYPTESLVANSGISEKAYKLNYFENMQEKTDGELLKEAKEARSASIKRRSEKNREWEDVKEQNTRTISDDFSASLKKYLK